MAKENKFGTFGGVFTPSLLTILGVIMYLRLPWVVGHAGLFGVLGIILVAHVISVATGLSISSIATDKNVGAGGPYYIVSRSMGLPIGGALGLALFIGLCFSTSLYVIGLTESLLASAGVQATPTAIRIVGTIALVVITGVTVVSTAFALKTQYIVLALIIGSLGVIFMGDGANAPAIANPDTSEPPNLAFLFGIFFPAVTGFTAGVNMSGDLKDPKKAIPTGTMAAIIVGLIVYLGLATFLHFRIPTEALIADGNILAHSAFRFAGTSSLLVLLGIWGATFSSGLGSIMGAPRILQALSSDQITPGVFAKGKGPTKEPRNALVLAFILAEAGILIAELNAIARIVSMVFLTMYAFLNITCAIEAKVSPDFRPSFRVPALVSVIGAATCFIIMVYLDLPAMLGATALMVGLFVYLQRKQLKLESGDAWEGIWSSMVRSGLFRITGQAEKQQRNWRPNILAFRTQDDAEESYSEFAQALITGNGILTDFEMRSDKKLAAIASRERADDEARASKSPKSKKKAPKTAQEERALGMFRRRLGIEGTPFEEIQIVCKHYGFSGLEPNSMLLPWALHADSPKEFGETIDKATDQDFNVLVYKDSETPPEHSKDKRTARVDIWWRVDEGNVGFCLALLRFLTRAPQWENSSVRFLLVSTDSANNDNLRSTMRRLLRDNRVEGEVKVVNDTFGDRSFVDRVRNLSSESHLTILGLPNEDGQTDNDKLAELKEICDNLGHVLLVRGNSSFKELLPTGRAATVSELPPLPGEEGAKELPELSISAVPDIATASTEYAESYQRLVGRLSDQCLSKVYGRHVELIRGIQKAATRHLEADKALKAGNPRRQRTAFNRQQSSFLLECQTLLESFTDSDLPDLRSILEGGLDAFLHDDAVVSVEQKALLVTRNRDDLRPAKGDSPYVRRFKRRRLVGSWLKRRSPQYQIPVSQLKRFYFQKATDELLAPALRGAVTETHQLMVQIGKLLNSSRAHVPDGGEEIALASIIESQKSQLLEHLDELDRQGKELLRRRRWTLIVDALTLTQKFADDIDRFDFTPLIKRERVPKDEDDLDELSELPGLWRKNQEKLCGRAKLALSLSGVQHRLTAIVSREREAIEIGMKNGAMSECTRLLDELPPLLETLQDSPEKLLEQNLHIDSKAQFDPQPIIDNLTQECGGSSDDVPVALKTLTDESIQSLEEGRLEAGEDVELPVRRLMQFLMETELVGGLQEELVRVPQAEQRALGIAQDVVRLVNFQLSELDANDDFDADEVRAQLRPVIENGIERLTSERADLIKLTGALLEEVDSRLHLVIDGTNAYELSASTGRLDQHIRVRQGKRAVSGARGLAKRILDRGRSAVVQLMYRRSEGILLAQKRKGTLRGSEQAVDRIASMVRSEVPSPEVLSALPFYYRQLFFGQSGINETFWVGRKEEFAKARLAARQFDSGASGCLLVVGDRLSGKSALLQKLSSDVFERRKVLRVHAPPGGSIDPRAFRRAIQKALGGERIEGGSSINSAIAAVPRGSVLILDDLNLWWERSEEGLRLIKQIFELIQSQGNRVLFVLSLETQAFRLINQLLPLSDSALAILECGPLPADALKSIVSLRHSSTGLKYRWGKKSEEHLGRIALARLFSHHFDHTGGSVGATLRTWVSSIQRVRGEVLEIRTPQRRDWEALDTLKSGWTALLIQLILHKQMGFERLKRVSGLSREDLKSELDALLRMGIVVESQRRVLEIEPGAYTALQERFSKRGMLP